MARQRAVDSWIADETRGVSSMETEFRKMRWMPWAVVLGTLLAAGQAFAHHGTNISYDRSKQWTRKATVVSFTCRFSASARASPMPVAEASKPVTSHPFEAR